MTEIRHSRQLARPKVPAKRKKPPRPGDSKEYLALIRQLPCAAGEAGPVDVHHCQNLIRHGLAQKVEDRYAIPLNHDLHMKLHNAGSRNHSAVLAFWGIDAANLTDALWRIWCDRDGDKLEQMRAAMKECRI